MANIGKWNKLVAFESTPRGLMMDGGDHGLILCPTRYLPEDAEPGEEHNVFVYLDSEDRLIATTEQALVLVGQFAALEVLSINPRVGAFLEWGLAKDLLLPFGEMLARPRVGERPVVAVAIDDRSGRIIASMRTNRHLSKSFPMYDDGQSVELLITEETALGFNAIVNHSHLGLIYHSELASPLKIGEPMDGYIQKVRPEGKIDLTLNKTGYGRVASLTDDIMEALNHAEDGTLAVGDKSSPDEIRRVFGVSKKAFKQALGALYKQRKISLEGGERIRLVK